MKKKKKNPYQTIKTSLKSILKEYDEIQPEINRLVIKCNDIVTQTYQFIKLLILHKYHNNQTIPEINERFILYCIKTQGIRDNRGKKAKDTSLLEELDDFYNMEFQPLIKNEKYNLKNLSFLLPYLAIQMNTSIQNNIKEHFLQHLFRFINITTNELTDDKSLKFKLKTAILNKNKEIPIDFMNWYNLHITNIIPSEIKKSIPYDIKAYPSKFLKCLIYMNSVLEGKEARLFQPLSLRNNIIPKYITIDTACLINLFAKKGSKGNLLSNVKDNKELIWAQLFKLNKSVFRNKHYKFNYQIQTDGIGVSLSFLRNDLVDKKYGSKTEKVNEEKYKYVNECSEKELKEYESKNIVGVDPGKQYIVYMVDKNNNKLKYSAPQRRIESMAKRNSKILLKEKNKNKIINKETHLAEHNSKTIDYDKFKDYIVEKTLLNKETRDFYIRDLFRKMKWRNFIYSRKSEDTFLNKIEEKFGKDIIIAYGDWSRSSQMKHFIPTKNKGIRKLIHKKYTTISVNEYNTSKKCCICYSQLEYIKHNEKKTFRHLSCSKCLSSENKHIVFKTRDVNSAINIRNLFQYYCMNKSRIKEFSPSCPSPLFSTEKVG